MPRRPNAPREAPGKYGAMARDEESGVRAAWTSASDATTTTDANDDDGGRRMRTRSKRKGARPGPPRAEPPKKLAKRIVGFVYDNLWIAFVAYALGAMFMLQKIPGESDFAKPADAAYFVAISATTVGYGDMSPKTDEGKVFVMVLLVTGVAIAGWR